MGLLTLVLVWHGRMVSKVVDRALSAFDDISSALHAMDARLTKIEHTLAGELRRSEDNERK